MLWFMILIHNSSIIKSYLCVSHLKKKKIMSTDEPSTGWQEPMIWIVINLVCKIIKDAFYYFPELKVTSRFFDQPTISDGKRLNLQNYK